MQGVAMGFARSAGRRSWIGEMRRVLLALLTVLDRTSGRGTAPLPSANCRPSGSNIRRSEPV